MEDKIYTHHVFGLLVHNLDNLEHVSAFSLLPESPVFDPLCKLVDILAGRRSTNLIEESILMRN